MGEKPNDRQRGGAHMEETRALREQLIGEFTTAYANTAALEPPARQNRATVPLK